MSDLDLLVEMFAKVVKSQWLSLTTRKKGDKRIHHICADFSVSPAWLSAKDAE